jgi:hypothetical protein
MLLLLPGLTAKEISILQTVWTWSKHPTCLRDPLLAHLFIWTRIPIAQNGGGNNTDRPDQQKNTPKQIQSKVNSRSQIIRL